MISSLSRRNTLLESLPSFFDNKPSWPSPADSVGQECMHIDGLHCWQVIGPALEAMEKLSLPIKELLDKHKEILEQGESKPRAVSFNMWMIGHLPVSADPTIVFSSKSKRQRTCAKALLKESKILGGYPGIKIKTLDKVPAIYQSADRSPADLFDTVFEDGVYMVDDSRGPCGALIAFGSSRMATMGGVLLINGTHYGISAQHARLRSVPEQEEISTGSGSPCFDDDSDIESEDVVETASSSFPGIIQQDADARCNIKSGVSSVNPQGVKGRQISSISASWVENDLDYELFQLDDPNLQSHNTTPLPENQGTAQTLVRPNHIERKLVESNVWVATGTTGLVYGAILRTPYFIKMERSQSFQELWAVRLDRKTMQGDCGAWVIDAVTGGIYGHIVAGDPFTGLAFIVPAYKIFDDIALRFGSVPLLPPEPRVTTSRALLASVHHARQQLTRYVQLKPARLLTMVLLWLLRRFANMRIPSREQEQFIQLILQSKALNKWLRAFELSVDAVDYIHLFFQAHGTSQQSQSCQKSRFVYHFEKADLDRHRLRLTPYAVGHDVDVSYHSFQMTIGRQNYDQAKSLGCLPADNCHSSSSGPSGGRPSTVIEFHERRGLLIEDQHTIKNPYGEAIRDWAVAIRRRIADREALLLQERFEPILDCGDERGFPTTCSFGILDPDSSSLSYALMEQSGELLASNSPSSPDIYTLPALQDPLLNLAVLQCPFDMLNCNSHTATGQTYCWLETSLCHFERFKPPTYVSPATKLVGHSRDELLSTYRGCGFECPIDSCRRMSKRKRDRARHMKKAHGWAYQRSDLVTSKSSIAPLARPLFLFPSSEEGVRFFPRKRACVLRQRQSSELTTRSPTYAFDTPAISKGPSFQYLLQATNIMEVHVRGLPSFETGFRRILAALFSSLDEHARMAVDVYRQDQVRKSDNYHIVLEELSHRSNQPNVGHWHNESSTLMECEPLGLRRSWRRIKSLDFFDLVNGLQNATDVEENETVLMLAFPEAITMKEIGTTVLLPDTGVHLQYYLVTQALEPVVAVEVCKWLWEAMGVELSLPDILWWCRISQGFGHYPLAALTVQEKERESTNSCTEVSRSWAKSGVGPIQLYLRYRRSGSRSPRHRSPSPFNQSGKCFDWDPNHHLQQRYLCVSCGEQCPFWSRKVYTC